MYITTGVCLLVKLLVHNLITKSFPNPFMPLCFDNIEVRVELHDIIMSNLFVVYNNMIAGGSTSTPVGLKVSTRIKECIGSCGYYACVAFIFYSMSRRPCLWAIRPISAVVMLSKLLAVAHCDHRALGFLQFPAALRNSAFSSSCCCHEHGQCYVDYAMKYTYELGGVPCGRLSPLHMVANEVNSAAKKNSGVKPPQFTTRKLGSFEKMLTQTRDGIGPAEDGTRTLLTPHVWVSLSLLGSTPNQSRIPWSTSLIQPYRT